MNTFKTTEQTFWANNLHVDEVVPWEIENLCNLLNAIFSEAVGHEVTGAKEMTARTRIAKPKRTILCC